MPKGKDKDPSGLKYTLAAARAEIERLTAQLKQARMVQDQLMQGRYEQSLRAEKAEAEKAEAEVAAATPNMGSAT